MESRSRSPTTSERRSRARNDADLCTFCAPRPAVRHAPCLVDGMRYIRTPFFRGHVDKHGRRVGIWIALVDGGVLVERYRAGELVDAVLVVASSPSRG